MGTGDRSPIIRALAGLASKTPLEVRVHLSRRWVELDTLARAKRLYHRLMSPGAHDSGILIYANLRRRQFSIVVAPSIIDRLGENYFRQLATLLEEDFHSTQPEMAISLCVRTLATSLGEHFPAE
jgi:hypothetical protein